MCHFHGMAVIVHEYRIGLKFMEMVIHQAVVYVHELNTE